VGVGWGEWEPFADAVGQQLDEAERAGARRSFDALMAARSERRQQLGALLARSGITVTTQDPGLQALDDWYQSNVEALPTGTHPTISTLVRDRPGHRALPSGTRSSSAPNIEWRLFTHGRKDVSYQRPVLMGFSGVPNPRYNVDPETLVGIHGHRLSADLEEPGDLFLQVVRRATANA
jgi:hypothetical protein